MQGICTACGGITSSGPRHPECGPAPRPSMRSRGYPPDWPRRRAEQLRRRPYCEATIPGIGPCGRKATTADHRINRRRLVASGHPDPDGSWNLQSLCSPCHSRKTAAETGFADRARRLRFGSSFAR